MIEGLFSSNTYQASKAMLDVTQARHEATAANIANQNTPGYQRLKVSETFMNHLHDAVKSRKYDHEGMSGPELVKDKDAKAIRPDGNTVKLADELLEMNENTLQHQFLTERVNASINQLRYAITGKR